MKNNKSRALVGLDGGLNNRIKPKATAHSLAINILPPQVVPAPDNPDPRILSRHTSEQARAAAVAIAEMQDRVNATWKLIGPYIVEGMNYHGGKGGVRVGKFPGGFAFEFIGPEGCECPICKQQAAFVEASKDEVPA